MSPKDSPAWYLRHVAECYRRVRSVIPSKKHAASTGRYVREFCRLNNLKDGDAAR